MAAIEEELLAEEDNIALDLKKLFHKSVKVTELDTVWEDFMTTYLAMDYNSALKTIRWGTYNPELILTRMVKTASEIKASQIESVVGVKMDLHMVSQPAVNWARDYAASEIKYISDSQRYAIRDIVMRGHIEGITPQAQGRMIRQYIGLDPRRAEAVVNYRDSLIEKGISEKEILKKTAKYSQQLLNDRAETIAVNEAVTSSAQGFYYETADAVERGILSPDRYVAYRIVTNDEQLCPICEEVDGEERELPDGIYASSGESDPKLHVLCRCTEGLKAK